MIHATKLHIDHPRFLAGSLTAYLIAGLIVAGATALRLTLIPWIAALPYVTFFPAVILATFLCGSAAGFLALVLSILSAWLFTFSWEVSYLPIYQTGLFGVGAVTVVMVVAAMRATSADIRRLNETLRVSEGKFRGLLESAADAIVIVDEQHRVALINARAEDLFGYRRTELLGQPIETLMPERSRQKYLAQLSAFVADPSAAPRGCMIDLDGVGKDGGEFPIEVSLAALKTEGGILVSNAVRDITERKQIEAGLAQASKAKSDFLANMSHELRTPLNAIIGFSEMIRDAVLGPLDARYRDYGSDISESGRHLQNIINDILDISKIEGGRLELREEIMSIGETVETCRRIVDAMAKAADVTMSIDVSGGLPHIRADQLRFQQILLNLMSNAVKFTPAGGRMSVSAAIETDVVVIAVEDTGIGMKAADIAIALEPFRQIEGPQNRRFVGTGLGLPLAKALVELHGGRLDIESVPGAGTTVRIRLPSERLMVAAA